MALPAILKTKSAFRLLLVLLLGLPALMQFDGDTAENRSLAPLPPLPTSWHAVLETPGKLDAWINDHFGFRKGLVAFNNRFHYTVFHEFTTPQLLAGRNDRIFLASHNKSFTENSAITSVCGPTDAPLAERADYANVMLGDFRAMGFRTELFIAPSAPVIEYHDLPEWLERSCSTENTPVTQILQLPMLDQENRQAILYPLDEMRTLSARQSMFPKTWFHWSGPQMQPVVDLSMEKLVGKPLPQPTALVWRSEREHSDVGGMAPGAPLDSEVNAPDFKASQIDACRGETCFPEFGSAARKIPDMSRFLNPKAPIARRLLILSDSFGKGAAGLYARYYQRVEHVSGNTFLQLDDAEIATLKKVLLRDPEHTDLLILFHDGGVVAYTMQAYLQRLHEPVLKPFQAPAADYADLVRLIYLSILGRAPDPGGLTNLSTLLSTTGVPTDVQGFNALYGRNQKVTEVVNSFGSSAEAQKLMTTDTPSFIVHAYERMFARQPSAAELETWSAAIDKRKLGFARVEMAIMAAAMTGKTVQDERDAEAVRGKLAEGGVH